MREQLWQMGKNLALRLTKDYPIMLQEVMGVLQNDYGFTAESKKLALESAIAHLDQMKTQLNNEIDAYAASLTKYKDQ